jgi:hypothetical protein
VQWMILCRARHGGAVLCACHGLSHGNGISLLDALTPAVVLASPEYMSAERPARETGHLDLSVSAATSSSTTPILLLLYRRAYLICYLSLDPRNNVI